MIGAMIAIIAGIALVIAALALALRRWFVVVVVRGPSMEPTLRDGDSVLVRRCRAPALAPGAIVVYEDADPGSVWVIKRLVARPGDPVPQPGFPALARNRDTVVPAGRLVVVGDNRARSRDSRQLGYLESTRIRGVVVRQLAAHPCSPAGSAPRCEHRCPIPIRRPSSMQLPRPRSSTTCWPSPASPPRPAITAPTSRPSRPRSKS